MCMNPLNLAQLLYKRLKSNWKDMLNWNTEKDYANIGEVIGASGGKQS